MPRKSAPSRIGLEDLHRILRILRAATRSLDTRVLFRSVVDSIHAEFPRFYHVSVFMVFEHAGLFVPMAIAGESPDHFVDRYPSGYTQGLEVGLLGRAWRTRATVLVNDVTADPEYHCAVTPVTLSELCVPIRVDEQVVGILNLESRKRHAFRPVDVEFFAILADHLANAVRNGLLLDQLAAGAGAPPVLADAGRAAEHTLRDVADGLPSPVLKVGPDGRIAFANAAALKSLSVAASQLIGHAVEEFLETRGGEAYRRGVADGGPFEIALTVGPRRRWQAAPAREGKPPYACLLKLAEGPSRPLAGRGGARARRRSR